MNLISLLIAVLIIGLIFSILWWLLGQFALPAPFRMVANAVLALICVIVLLGMLFGSISIPSFRLS